MSMIIDGTDGLTFNDSSTQNVTALNASNINAGTLGEARLPTGSVLQVVSASTSTAVTNATTTYADTGLTATITPKFSTSKIFVIVTHPECVKTNTNSNNSIDMKLVRGSTQIAYLSGVLGNTGTAIEFYFCANGSYLDSPATTSSTTYKTQFKNTAAASYVGVQVNSTTSTITLMEIAA
jgi:hypothetical protein